MSCIYKIIIPFDTQGFLLDAQVLNRAFPSSKIYYSSHSVTLEKTPVNIFIDRVQHQSVLSTADINILSANHEILLKKKDYAWQIGFMKKLDYVLCKTKYGKKIIKNLKKKYNLKFEIYYIGHTTIFPKKNIHKRDYHTILYLAGAHQFKNTDAVIKCWLKYDNLPNIIIGCYENCIKTQLEQYITKEEYEKITTKNNVKFISNKVDYNDVVIMKYYYAIHLCPSMQEGFGHYINEGRITKSCVITTDLPPMNELIDNHSGILINCDAVIPKDNGAEICIIEPNTLAKIIQEVMILPESVINDYGLKAYHKYILDKKFFIDRSKKFNHLIQKKLNLDKLFL